MTGSPPRMGTDEFVSRVDRVTNTGFGLTCGGGAGSSVRPIVETKGGRVARSGGGAFTGVAGASIKSR